MGYNVCKCCRIPDRPGYGNPEYENDFTCADCACFSCHHREDCDAQCAKEEQPINWERENIGKPYLDFRF